VNSRYVAILAAYAMGIALILGIGPANNYLGLLIWTGYCLLQYIIIKDDIKQEKIKNG
jgi:hypothetical protein